MGIFIRPLCDEDILDMQTWKYSPPYDLYSFGYMPVDEALAFFKDPENGYFALSNNEDQLTGFCNFGDDGRVEGGDYSIEAVDVGIGIRPELTGKGDGEHYASAVFREAKRRFPGRALRVTVAAFNQRAQRVCEKLGFQRTDSFRRPSDGKKFLILCLDN